jgi:hypothetical protein
MVRTRFLCLIIRQLFLLCPCSDFKYFSCTQNLKVPSLKARTTLWVITFKKYEFWTHYKKQFILDTVYLPPTLNCCNSSPSYSVLVQQVSPYRATPHSSIRLDHFWLGWTWRARMIIISRQNLQIFSISFFDTKRFSNGKTTILCITCSRIY